MEKFDIYAQAMSELSNPTDLATMAEKFPNHNAQGEHPEYNAQELYGNPDSDFLKEEISSSFVVNKRYLLLYIFRHPLVFSR